MRPSKKNSPTIIKELLKDFFKEHKKKKATLEERILGHWPQIMPKKAGECTRPVAIKNKVLVVLVSNSAWLHQLTLKKSRILKKINKISHEEQLVDIRFKIGQ